MILLTYKLTKKKCHLQKLISHDRFFSISLPSHQVLASRSTKELGDKKAIIVKNFNLLFLE